MAPVSWRIVGESAVVSRFAMARLEARFARVTALHDRIAARPRIDAYLESARRISFNEQGIFRHYPELDNAG